MMCGCHCRMCQALSIACICHWRERKQCLATSAPAVPLRRQFAAAERQSKRKSACQESHLTVDIRAVCTQGRRHSSMPDGGCAVIFSHGPDTLCQAPRPCGIHVSMHLACLICKLLYWAWLRVCMWNVAAPIQQQRRRRVRRVQMHALRALLLLCGKHCSFRSQVRACSLVQQYLCMHMHACQT